MLFMTLSRMVTSSSSDFTRAPRSRRTNQRLLRGMGIVFAFGNTGSPELPDAVSPAASRCVFQKRLRSIQNSSLSALRSLRTEFDWAIVGGPRTWTFTPGRTTPRPESAPK